MNFVLARLKTVTALAGVALMLLQFYASAKPSPVLSAIIALLTALGVHQTPNL